MSILTLQIGQCGNQLGHELFSVLSKDNAVPHRCASEDSQYVNESTNTWFSSRKRGPHLARAILVDTESKVVNDISQRPVLSGSNWRYSDACKISSTSGGSGNNWAHGFYVKGPEFCDRVLECVRKESEKLDVSFAVLNLLSTSGGTGSGLGSYVIEKLRNEFGLKKFMNVIVLPYSFGEVGTQNYNTVLTLAKLYDVSDLHFIFQNEQLHRMCVSLLGQKNTELSDINNLIARKMASVFQPVQVFSGVSNIVPHMAAHPVFKLVTVKTAPHTSSVSQKFESTLAWPVLVKHMKRTLQKGPLSCAASVDWEARQPSSRSLSTFVSHFVPSVANVLITRGCGPPSADTVSELSSQLPYCRWVPQDTRLLHFHQTRRFLGNDKFITMVSNNSLVCQPLDSIVDKAWTAFTYKAYLHHYSKYGVEEEEFKEAFLKLESILKYYGDISKDSV